MFYYKIGDMVLETDRELNSYKAFICEPTLPHVTVTATNELPPPGLEIVSRIVHRKLEDGWFFHLKSKEQRGLYINEDYSQLRVLGTDGNKIMGIVSESEWLIRLALECALVRRGFLSLHAASVEVQGEAYAFSGPSGIGKSTRSVAWKEALGAELISGDRPLIDTKKMEVYGVPWDGKEQCFRNVHYPLKAICEVRRSNSVYIRSMNLDQRRKLLLKQCFMPMWDTETAIYQFANITRLAAGAEMVRVFSGPYEKDARALYSALQNHKYLKEEKEMKAKEGFILRNVVDEHILMPTGDNIGRFNGTVLMNDVSAFIWEKMKNPISREDLLIAILDEFEVEKTIASADLDALLSTLKEYGVIEDD